MIRRFPARLRSPGLLIAGLLVLGMALVVVFAGRALHDYQRLQRQGLQPGVTDVEAIRGWMTLPYIAHAYNVPEDALFAALAIPPEGNRNLPLRRVAERYDRDPLVVRETIRQTILRLRPLPTLQARP